MSEGQQTNHGGGKPPEEENVQDQMGQEHTKASDPVAQTNLVTLGLGPAMAMVNSYMAQSNAQGLMFTNAVQQQQREAMAGLSVATESASRILNLDFEEDPNRYA